MVGSALLLRNVKNVDQLVVFMTGKKINDTFSGLPDANNDVMK